MKRAFIFTGQGAQTTGMLQDFYEEYSSVRNIFQIANNLYNLSFEKIIFEEDKRLHQTKYTQPAMFLLYTSILEVLKDTDLAIDYSFGLSLGEYGALYHQGVFDLETGFQLIKYRAEAMETVNKSGSMAAILGMTDSQLQEIVQEVEGTVVIANYNTIGQLVISGDTNAVKIASEKALANGAKRAIPLHTSKAFHSPHMTEASKQFNSDLSAFELNEPKGTLLLNVTGKPYDKNLKESMVKQIDHSVMFIDSVKQALADGVTDFIEIGPKKTLSSFVRKIDRSANTYCISSIDSYHKVIQQLEVK